MVFSFNPLAGRDFPTDPYARDEAVRAALVPVARHFIATMKKQELFTFGEIIHFTILAMGRASQTVLWPPGTTVTHEIVRESIVMGCRVALAVMDAPEPHWALATWLGDQLETWLRDTKYIDDRYILGTATEREVAIYAGKQFIGKFGPVRNLEQFLNVTRRLSRPIYPDAPVAERGALARDLLITFHRTRNGEKQGLYVDKDTGMVFLSKGDARDRLFSVFGVPRGPSSHDQPPNHDHVERETTPGLEATVVDANTIDALAAITAIEEVEAQRRWIDERKRMERPGSVALEVLPYLLPFVEEELPASEIARRVDRAETAVRKALRTHAQRMATDLGLIPGFSEF